MSSPSSFAVTFERVRVEFSRWGQTVTALDDVDIHIPAAQWLVLVGHNGAGKSCLLRTLVRRSPISSGTIRIGGRLIGGYSRAELARSVYYVHQDPLVGTAPELTVFENLLIADPESRTSGRRALMAHYEEFLRPLDLQHRLRQPVATLSGGERQALALRIAGMVAARIVLLDEPLGSLDPANTRLCLEQIRLLHRSRKTVILVTHDERLAVAVGDRTVVLRHGALVYDASGANRRLEELVGHWHNLPREADR